MGMLASQFVLEWNHWIAFVLLVFLGGRMVIEGFRGNDDDCEAPRRHGFWLLVTTAFATSLDAMAVGVGLAFLQVNIIATALAIGCATLIMSTLGMMVGRFIGPLLGKRAEIRRYRADWHRRPDPLEPFRRLISGLALPAVDHKIGLAAKSPARRSVSRTGGLARHANGVICSNASASPRQLHRIGQLLLLLA
jgi:hypothetical protein